MSHKCVMDSLIAFDDCRLPEAAFMSGCLGMKSLPWALLTLVCIGCSALAAEEPHPLVFLAGVAALRERCVALHPEMKDDAPKGDERSSPSDRELVRLLKTSPEYQYALASARKQVLALPAENVEMECAAIHKEANRQLTPGHNW